MIRWLISATQAEVLNVDLLTYAGNPNSLRGVELDSRYSFCKGDVCDTQLLDRLFREYRPQAVIHLAAESHVDRSIDGPSVFVRTNVLGTYSLLESATRYFNSIAPESRKAFRLLHVSTDEVFGALGAHDRPFNESSHYDPRSPYSATKAASDHLIRAWFHTFRLPVIISNCSNNYGPYQFPEKLIPNVILRGMRGKSIPVYGEGANVRDWIYVDDHASALHRLMEAGRPGETYLVGARNERRNIDLVMDICRMLDEMSPKADGVPHERMIRFVSDRPGHDSRYAIDSTKITEQLGWRPQETPATGLRKTVEWYFNNTKWWSPLLDGGYKLERVGLLNTTMAGEDSSL